MSQRRKDETSHFSQEISPPSLPSRCVSVSASWQIGSLVFILFKICPPVSSTSSCVQAQRHGRGNGWENDPLDTGHSQSRHTAVFGFSFYQQILTSTKRHKLGASRRQNKAEKKKRHGDTFRASGSHYHRLWGHSEKGCGHRQAYLRLKHKLGHTICNQIFHRAPERCGKGRA